MSKHGRPARRSSGACEILCVDDEPSPGDLLRYALEREGYRVRLAATAGGALQFLAADRPDLILLGVQLPDAGGLALCLAAHDEQTPGIGAAVRCSGT